MIDDSVAALGRMGPMTDLAAIEHAAMADVVVVRTELDVIEVVGSDAASYLHGQLSQDVEGLSPGETRWTLLLQPQGKIDAWMRVHRLGPEHFVLVVEPGFGAAAQARLERFKLRVAVELDTSTRAALSLRGPRAEELVGSLDLDIDLVAVDARWGGLGIDLIAASEVDLDGIVPDDVVVADIDALEMIRIGNGRPSMGAELDASTIPAAAGIVSASVDFSKGCYVGQELVARIDSRGNNTPTSLVRLQLSAPLAELAVGMALTIDGESIGTVTSLAPTTAQHAIGLGYVKRGVDVPGVAEVEIDGPRMAGVTLAELPSGLADKQR